MSLQKKIVITFLISASIIANLVAFDYINFIEIKQEIRYLEVTDTVRTKSLQLRRHEKNFFLYSPQKAGEESREVHRYIGELNSVISDNIQNDKTGNLTRLKALVDDYTLRFKRIEAVVKSLTDELDRTKVSNKGDYKFFPLIKLTFLERPGDGADFLEKVFNLPGDLVLISGLRELDKDIASLRKDGEDIIALSKELDKTARDKVDRSILMSQVAMFTFFPLFLIVGIGTLIYIISNITKRLKVLSSAIERTGKGAHPYKQLAPTKWASNDEVGLLISKFNDMEELLAQREEELDRKNKELLHSKKLAAIGTLASGVAHEINNPLNNIYISAQVLAREVGGENPACSGAVKEVVSDIMGQTARVKRIVGDLLEFARGKEPVLRRVDLPELVKGVYGLLGGVDVNKVRFRLDPDGGDASVLADPEQMERVFINLFMNAVDAMGGEGDLTVEMATDEDYVITKVTDTGRGIKPDDQEKVFEPFYTTKDKGTGLGLAIVFNIIKKHGGEITVSSVPEKGTTFTIKLPKGDV